MFIFDKDHDSIAVTGGRGFLGTHVINELYNRGYKNIYSLNKNFDPNPLVKSIHVDLRNYAQVKRIFYTASPDRLKNVKAVINLAANVGGIGANQKYPASFMSSSLSIGLNLIDACLHTKSMQRGGKFVQIGTVCAYPKFCPTPFREENLWDGYPEETNAPYGIAKKAIMELVKHTNIEYKGKFHGISLIPVNLYGPSDNFDLESSHVIPALIRKFYEAKINQSPSVTLWGTGKATREFLYVKDAAYGIVEALEKYEKNEPVNLGTGADISISELANLIGSLVGYNGQVLFDSSKPDGQPKRMLEVSKAYYDFGFKAKTDLYYGLEQTVKWFMENKEKCK